MYEWMLRVRMFDTRMVMLQRQGRIGFYAPSTGEEAAQIGTAWSLRPGDWVFPAYREQGVILFRGCPMETLICQLIGNGAHQLQVAAGEYFWRSLLNVQHPKDLVPDFYRHGKFRLCFRQERVSGKKYNFIHIIGKKGSGSFRRIAYNPCART